ncbi:Gfo/Idh/MocA family oxidoreductase [Marinifilum caeruleilacunae]|uniref:Twin-arginine translocation signal domain-containing protein n=1 Tax=Marinifilum caeruleilacunae TaxID=2499076 RepID=A0ABX1WZM1_9BACT|nr:Gfo/Idh/MocA family oxidoreductase [Marinifilum caeruleilacunae]NOU61280.1 twin-arginine translocation signal domain-containing protein [Marinifilum caeruleilacunae]
MTKRSSRRDFIKTSTLATAGITMAGMGMSAKSYGKIIGSNDRMQVAIAGLGRRYKAFLGGIAHKESNVELLYLCDVMDHQLEKASKKCSDLFGYKSKLEKDVRKVIADKNVDALFIATPDHWHTPGALMALEAGKHVYIEKPCSHNMFENELLIAAQQKYNKAIQMGNQQRSAVHSIEIISQIHNGLIGDVYKAVAFYSNKRGEVPTPQKAAVPTGLDWDLFQGPSPRKEYTHDTWNYNWHWYGWDFGTAEMGNNATHELDIARWALDVKYPEQVFVEADKRHYKNDGWEMYDTMEATFKFENGKVITWDGKSRNAFNTYGAGRGTIIYGTEGTVWVDRELYRIFDRKGKLVKEVLSATKESGTALGGGGETSTLHVRNFFDAARGKDKLTSPITQGAISQAMTHYANIAYRIGKGFDIDSHSGRIFDRDAMKLWGREYEKGWEPKL